MAVTYVYLLHITAIFDELGFKSETSLDTSEKIFCIEDVKALCSAHKVAVMCNFNIISQPALMSGALCYCT